MYVHPVLHVLAGESALLDLLLKRQASVIFAV